MSLPQRKSPRWKEYDYSTPWAYFVTVCTQDRIHFFGEVVGSWLASTDSHQNQPLTDSHYNNMHLTDIGRICNKEINHMMQLRTDVEMREYVIMPNHVHLLFSFGSITQAVEAEVNNSAVEASHDPTQVSNNQTLSSIVGSLKSAVTRECSKQWLKNWLWSFARQRSFHDHVVRNQQEFDAIRCYIKTNPQNRENDTFNK